MESLTAGEKVILVIKANLKFAYPNKLLFLTEYLQMYSLIMTAFFSTRQ